MSPRLRDWWMGGGFFSVATIVISAAVTWGATTATNRADQASVTRGLAAVHDQIEDVKIQIAGVRSAQDGVLKLEGEVSAIRQRLSNLEGDYKTQVQINASLQADIARLQGDVAYLGRN